jgi:hypothetical protein
VSAEEDAMTADEQAALDRVLSTFGPDNVIVGKFEPYAKDETEDEPPTLLAEADAAFEEELAESRSSWRAVDLRGHMGVDDGRDAPTLLRRSDGLTFFFYGGKRNEVHGPSEAGKSWVAQLVVQEVIERGETAVWIDFEDTPRAVVMRLLALGVDEATIIANFRYIQPAERLTDATVIDLRLELVSATLVVIDAANEAMTAAGLDPNSNRDIAAWYDTIPRLATREGAAVIVLDHVAKDPQQRRGATGGGHKTAALDGASYALDVVTAFGRGSKGLVRMTLGKDRPGYVRGRFEGLHPTVAEIAFDGTDPDNLIIEVNEPAATRDSEDWRPTHLMEAVSRFLEPLDEPASRRTITEAVKGKQAYVVDAIDALVAEDFVKRSAGPRNAALHVSIKPFREGPE